MSSLGDLTIPANRTDAQRQANALRAAAAFVAGSRDQLAKILPDTSYLTQLTQIARDMEYDARGIEEELDLTAEGRQ